MQISPVDDTTNGLHEVLVTSLEDLIKIYRSLLDVVRKEKELLITAKIDDLSENNRSKEALVQKSKNLEQIRIKNVKDLAAHLGFKDPSPRLKDIAVLLNYEKAERLRNLHSVLELIL